MRNAAEKVPCGARPGTHNSCKDRCQHSRRGLSTDGYQQQSRTSAGGPAFGRRPGSVPERPCFQGTHSSIYVVQKSTCVERDEEVE